MSQSPKDTLQERTAAFMEHFAHLVNWQVFERAAAVVNELEEELTKHGLNLGPVEEATRFVVDVADAIHDRLTGADEPVHPDGPF